MTKHLQEFTETDWISKQAPQRRTLIMRFQQFYDFLKQSSTPVRKGYFRKIGLNSATVDRYIKIVRYVHSKRSLEMINHTHHLYLRLKQEHRSTSSEKRVNPNSFCKKRTLYQQIEDFYQFLETRNGFVCLSRLKSWRFNSQSAKLIAYLIIFIQSQPEILSSPDYEHEHFFLSSKSPNN